VAGARDLVRWAIGSRTGRTGAAGDGKGCWDALTTLGEWSSPKTSRQGVTWNVGAEAIGVSKIVAGCGGGLTAVLGDHVGLVLGGEAATTLGDSCKFTLGGEGAGRQVGRRDGGASVHHDSKIS
jgi:hypothetical protein